MVRRQPVHRKAKYSTCHLKQTSTAKIVKQLIENRCHNQVSIFLRLKCSLQGKEYSLDFHINTCSFGNLNWALLCLVAKLEQQGTNEPQSHGEVEQRLMV